MVRTHPGNKKQYESIFLRYALYFERKTMRKLALSDEILLSVDKAARYIGGELTL